MDWEGTVAARRIGPVELEAGAVARNYLPVAELADGMSQVRIPVWAMRGAADGPVLYLHSGAHGQETVYSFEALRRLFETVAPVTLRGTLVAVPIANPLAHLAACRLSLSTALARASPSPATCTRSGPATRPAASPNASPRRCGATC